MSATRPPRRPLSDRRSRWQAAKRNALLEMGIGVLLLAGGIALGVVVWNEHHSLSLGSLALLIVGVATGVHGGRQFQRARTALRTGPESPPRREDRL